MSHTEKQRIFDQYADNKGYGDWEELLYEFSLGLKNEDEFMLDVFAACDLVQQEQQKRIAGNQRKIFYKFYEEGKNNFICAIQANTADKAYEEAYSIHGPQVEDWFYQIMTDEEQILMSENLIR